jgi:hypothetical protein
MLPTFWNHQRLLACTNGLLTSITLWVPLKQAMRATVH